MATMEWDYVWIALFINFVIVYLVPRVFRKPTGVQLVDDLVLYLNAQKDMLVSSSIVVALAVYGSHYWISNRSEASESPCAAVAAMRHQSKMPYPA
jgi:hypothetical protein